MMIDKRQYNQIQIPQNLSQVIDTAIKDGKKARRQHTFFKAVKIAAGMAAVFMVSFISMLNISPAFAKAAYQIPVVGQVCRVFTFREYHFEDEIQYADIKIPQIQNTGKTQLEKQINLEIQRAIGNCVDQCQQVAKDYYNAFVQTGGDPADFKPVGITVDYKVTCSNQQYVSFIIYQYQTAFQAYNNTFYYNIGLSTGKQFTLKDWFGQNYRQIVANSIQNTINSWPQEQQQALWPDLNIIDLIDENTNFYIDQNGNAVVVFEKYQAAYGAAGALELVIDSPHQP